MANMERVRAHLHEQAKAHHQTHQEALRLAAIARSEQEAANPVNVPRTGLQDPQDDFWQVED